MIKWLRWERNLLWDIVQLSFSPDPDIVSTAGDLLQSCNEDPLKILRNYYRGEGIAKESIIEGKG